jgi:hypothetical protein
MSGFGANAMLPSALPQTIGVDAAASAHMIHGDGTGRLGM